MKKEIERIGIKIRERRKALGLTQAQVADGHITRNMLSLIESGTALPSLETTVRIAKKLCVSTDYLLTDTATLSEASLSAALPTIRNLFKNKEYAACLAYAEKYCETTNDETAFVLGYCALEEGKKAVNAGKLDTAASLLEIADRYAAATMYPTEALSAAISVYRAVAINVQSPRLELDQVRYWQCLSDAAFVEFFAYLTEDTDFPYTSDKLKQHLDARALIRRHEYRKALSILEALEDARTDRDITVIFLFRIYTDMEACHRELRNFENAYRYSSKRMSLLNAFHS